MFPNVRLLIGAVLASVAALSCGFGVFAAFRVNHDPLSRLPADAAALQLVTSEAVGPRPAWGAPFGSSFSASASVSEARIGAVTDAPAPMPVRGDALEPVRPASLQPAAATDPSPERAPPQRAPQSTGPSAAAIPTEPPAPIEGASKAPARSAPVANASPVTSPSGADTPSGEPAPEAKRNSPGKTGEPALAPITAVAAVEPPPSPAPPAAPPAVVTETTPDAASPGTTIPSKLGSHHSTPRKVVRKPVERRRVAARRPIKRQARPRAVAQAGDQISDYRNPVFQSAPSALQRQPATNARSDKRTSDNAPGNNAGNSYGWVTAH